MKQLEKVTKAMGLFPKCFINSNNELILIPDCNVYIPLDDVNSNSDFIVRFIENLSRACSCSLPYRSDWRNNKYHTENLIRFNAIVGTDFSWGDMMLIYSKLGNGINRNLTYEFLKSGFNLKILKDNRRA